MIEQRAERILSIDVIRGFALIGIFFVNLPTMESIIPISYQNSFEAGLQFFYELFIQTKFYVIFSFLFGVSAYYFMRSQERKGLPYKKLFLIRVAWLFVFGVIHMVFIWYGDILHNYALIGLVLPFLYKFSPKKIFIIAGILFIMSFGIKELPYLVQEFSNPSQEMIEETGSAQGAKNAEDVESNEDVEFFNADNMSMTYLDKVKQNAGILFSSFPYFILNNLEILSLALFGLGLAKANFFEEFNRFKKLTKRIAIIALVLALPIMALMVKDYLNGLPLANNFYVWLTGKLLAIVYVTILLFACENIRLREKLSFLSSYGKMAFTNYLAQSIITIYIMIPILPKFTLTVQLIYCIVFLTLQIILSKMVMKKYKYGPFEYAWRKLVFLGK